MISFIRQALFTALKMNESLLPDLQTSPRRPTV
jgi:hypothetical protein